MNRLPPCSKEWGGFFFAQKKKTPRKQKRRAKPQRLPRNPDNRIFHFVARFFSVSEESNL